MYPLHALVVGHHRALPALEVVHIAASLQQRLAAGDICEQSRCAVAPPRLSWRPPAAPHPEGHARLSLGPRVLCRGMQHHAVHAQAEGTIGGGLQCCGVVLPGVQRPAGEPLGPHLFVAYAVGGAGHPWHVLPPPAVGLRPELGTDGVIGCHLPHYLLRVDGVEGLGRASAVGLHQQLQPVLMCQLAHVAIVVLGKEVAHRLLPVAPHSQCGLWAVYHGQSRQGGQPWQQGVAAPLLKLLGHPSRPLLSSSLIAVNLQPLERLARFAARQGEELLRIGLPVAAHGLAAHLVALQAHAAGRSRGIVGLAIGGVAKANHAVAIAHASEAGGELTRTKHVDVAQTDKAVIGHHQHGNVFVVVPLCIHLRLLWQPYQPISRHALLRPHQFLHGIGWRHRGESTRRPPWAVVGAKRQAQAAALADGVLHQPSPRVGADGVGRVAYRHLHGASHQKLLHPADARLLVGLQVGGDAFGAHQPVHPLPNHDGLGLGGRLAEGIIHALLGQRVLRHDYDAEQKQKSFCNHK